MRVPPLVVLLVVAATGSARADTITPLAQDNAWSADPPRELSVDASLAFGAPSLLPTGLSTGIGAGVLYAPCLGPLAYGARISWSAATESSEAWEVTHDDIRARAIVAVQHSPGRGTLGLRLGLGGVIVHESRTRHQGARAGLTGDDLAMSATALMPEASIEATIALRIAGAFSVAIAGGPTALLHDGAVATGWVGEIGVLWQP